MKPSIIKYICLWLNFVLIVMFVVMHIKMKQLADSIKENDDNIYLSIESHIDTVSKEMADRQLSIMDMLDPDKTDKKLEELKSGYDTERCDELQSEIDKKYIWYDNWFCTFQEIPFDEIWVDSPMFIKCEWMVAYVNRYQWQSNLDLNHMPYQVIKSIASDRKAWENYFLEANYVMNNCKWFAYVNKDYPDRVVR